MKSTSVKSESTIPSSGLPQDASASTSGSMDNNNKGCFVNPLFDEDRKVASRSSGANVTCGDDVCTDDEDDEDEEEEVEEEEEETSASGPHFMKILSPKRRGSDAECAVPMHQTDEWRSVKATAARRRRRQRAKSELMSSLNTDYDNRVEQIADYAIASVAETSLRNCGLYQFISFIFISIAWTVGNGWYAYVSVFTGYTPNHTCDTMGLANVTTIDDNQCSLIDTNTNASVPCIHWTYATDQMRSTMISEFNFVCAKVGPITTFFC